MTPTTVKFSLLLRQIGAALAFAHRQNVVHRDLKPANILLDEEGNAYLSDFGIAKLFDSAMPATREGILGTLYYSSPEQIRNEPVTPQSDIYRRSAISAFDTPTSRRACVSPTFPGAHRSKRQR